MGGRIRRNGQATPDVALTAGVQWLEIKEGDLVHVTGSGVWRYTGQPDWELVKPVLTVLAEGQA